MRLFGRLGQVNSAQQTRSLLDWWLEICGSETQERVEVRVVGLRKPFTYILVGWLQRVSKTAITDFGKYSSSKFRTRKEEEIQFDAAKRMGMFIGFMMENYMLISLSLLKGA